MTSFTGAVEPASFSSSEIDGMLKLDARHRCVYADGVLAHILGIDTAALAGQPLVETPLPKPLIEMLLEAASAARASGVARRAHLQLSGSGSGRVFSILALPEPANDTVTLVVSPGARTANAAPDERFARLRAESALFMRDHVLSLVSHDLRGPLNAIHSWAYVLERKLDSADPAAQRALAGIRAGVDQQVKLLEQAVDATRAETKALALERTPFALRPLIDSVADDVRRMLAAARGVSVSIDSPLAEETLEGDRERLSQALWAMLAFAVEASARGSAVTLQSSIDGATWHAAVTHTASMAALGDATLPHAFEAFARRQATFPREAGRIAWVLALVKRVAEVHGGTFAQSETVDGEPATLTLRIPLATA
jgi:signal transduction histidine kinase